MLVLLVYPQSADLISFFFRCAEVEHTTFSMFFLLGVLTLQPPFWNPRIGLTFIQCYVAVKKPTDLLLRINQLFFSTSDLVCGNNERKILLIMHGFRQPVKTVVGFTVGQKTVKPTCAGGALTAYLMMLLKLWRLSHFWLLVDFFIAIIFETFFMSLFHLPKTSCANY